MNPADELRAWLEQENQAHFPEEKTNWQAETNPQWHPDQFAEPGIRNYDDEDAPHRH